MFLKKENFLKTEIFGLFYVHNSAKYYITLALGLPHKLKDQNFKKEIQKHHFLRSKVHANFTQKNHFDLSYEVSLS